MIPYMVAKLAPYSSYLTRGWSNMSPVRAIFVPFPPKTGTNMLHPRPPAIVELVCGGCGLYRFQSVLKTSSCSLLKLFDISVSAIHCDGLP